MVQKIELALANEIKKIFKNEKIYIEKIRQGIEFPCFYFSLINSTKKKVAYIDYMQIITLDIQYLIDINQNDNNKTFSEAIEKLNGISNFKIEGVGNIEIDVEGVDIVDDVLHYQIVLNVPLQQVQNSNLIRKSTNKTYLLIQNKLEEVTGKKVFYINGDLKELENSFFVIEPNYIETVNIGLNGTKKHDRNIQIRYVTTNLSQDIPDFLEQTMDKLLLEFRKIEGYISFNYDIDIDYESEEFKGLNVISHELNLHLTERKK